MTHLSLKEGMKHWKGKGRAAYKSEMKQLHLRDKFNPNHYKDLNRYQKKIILESQMFLKEKRDGTIKGRGLAGGNKQRKFTPK